MKMAKPAFIRNMVLLDLLLSTGLIKELTWYQCQNLSHVGWLKRDKITKRVMLDRQHLLRPLCPDARLTAIGPWPSICSIYSPTIKRIRVPAGDMRVPAGIKQSAYTLTLICAARYYA